MKIIKIQIYSNDLEETNKRYIHQLNTELTEGKIMSYSIGIEKE